jgi:hypothetical protein
MARIQATAALLILVFLHICQAFLPQSASTLRTFRSLDTQRQFFNFGKSNQQAPTPETPEEPPPEPEEEPDAVEKLFSFFFGKPEEEPMGLKRFGRERFPEQYPATVDEWAEPLETDDREMSVLRPLLKNTNMETRGLKLTYSASRNGWNAAKFHKAVDKKGGALVVCKTEQGLLCGG